MSQPYVGEIRLFPYTFAPNGWLACEGQLIPISENETLFALIGTTYGGDGESTFALPDFRGRVPVHNGQGAGLSAYVLGQVGGVEAVTLTQQQIPQHNHVVAATTAAATTSTPGPGVLPAAVSGDTFYVSTIAGNNAAAMATNAVGIGGGSQPHENTMPTLAMTYCISMFGIFPTSN